jgi:hypothetical protein
LTTTGLPIRTSQQLSSTRYLRKLATNSKSSAPVNHWRAPAASSLLKAATLARSP